MQGYGAHGQYDGYPYMYAPPPGPPPQNGYPAAYQMARPQGSRTTSGGMVPPSPYGQPVVPVATSRQAAAARPPRRVQERSYSDQPREQAKRPAQEERESSRRPLRSAMKKSKRSERDAPAPAPAPPLLSRSRTVPPAETESALRRPKSISDARTNAAALGGMTRARTLSDVKNRPRANSSTRPRPTTVNHHHYTPGAHTSPYLELILTLVDVQVISSFRSMAATR